MPGDRAVLLRWTHRALVGVAFAWVSLVVPLAAQQADALQPEVSVTIKNPPPAAPDVGERLIGAASHLPVIAFWIGVSCIAGLSLWAVSCLIRAWPRRGLTHILFEDLSAGRDERLDRNRTLAQSLISRLQNPQPLPTFDLQMDVMPGAKEPGFGGLEPVLTMTSVLNYERTDRAIRIGAIEFSLRDLLTIISTWFTRPPGQHLEGWLTETHGAIALGAQMLDHRRQPLFARNGALVSAREAARAQQSGNKDDLARPLAWLVRAAGEREPAIADLAAQILVDTGRSTLTSDWRSLRSFDEAMRLRDDQHFDSHPEASPPVDRQARTSDARGHLARAVSYDPSNWIARFSLAVTLSRDNEPLLAIEHLTILESAVARAWPYVRKTDSSSTAAGAPDAFEGPGFNQLVRHLETLPECAFLVLFNRGIACAACRNDLDKLRRARGVLEQLSNWMPTESGCTSRSAPVAEFEEPYRTIGCHVSEQVRTTLALYAMGAHASLIADTATGSGMNLEPQPVLALERLLARINADCRIRNATHWPSAMSARAIVQAALGQVLFHKGYVNEAQQHFEAALGAEPRLVRALLGLGEIYLRHAERQSTVSGCDPDGISEWLTRADALVGRAMTINAGCAEGRRLSNRVHQSPYFAGGRATAVATRNRAADREPRYSQL